MKFLCLAYGDEKEWNRLSKAEQEGFLAQDEVLRRRGDTVAAVDQNPVLVRAWSGTPEVTDGPFAHLPQPFAGFGIIEAENLDEAVRLIADTPCARVGGHVEIRRITEINRRP